jgi:hypothetical protein
LRLQFRVLRRSLHRLEHVNHAAGRGDVFDAVGAVVHELRERDARGALHARVAAESAHGVHDELHAAALFELGAPRAAAQRLAGARHSTSTSTRASCSSSAT